MENAFKIARIVVTFLVFIFFYMVLFSYDITFPLVYALITYGMNSPVIGIGEFIISKGDHIGNTFKRMLYYFVLLPFLITVIFLVVYYSLRNSGMGLVIMFIIAAMVSIFAAPYIQALLVLLFRKILKQKITRKV